MNGREFSTLELALVSPVYTCWKAKISLLQMIRFAKKENPDNIQVSQAIFSKGNEEYIEET